MASLAGARTAWGSEARFFLVSAIAMALVLVAGFSFQLAMGRSTFASPLPLHLHALLFFGWTFFYLLQTALVATGSSAVHRRFGWLAVVWVPAMLFMGIYVTVMVVRRGATPFFFEPLYFLVMNPMTLVAFAGFTTAAIVLRRRTQWHRRLMFCGMALLTGPGFGRLLPMPLLIPYAGWATFAAVMLFPIAGVVRDLRSEGRVHPAWWWGIGAIVAMQVSIDLISRSGVGTAIYDAALKGSPGASVPPLAFPPPPGM